MDIIFKKFTNAQENIDDKIKNLRKNAKSIRAKMRNASSDATKLRNLEATHREKQLEIRRLRRRSRGILDASANLYRNAKNYKRNELRAMAQNDVNTLVRHIKYWSSV
jgi:hypothetical protein